jgi:hypothetical protein
MFRLSSTPLSLYLQCPRRWFFSQLDPKNLDTPAINFGKLFHALMEATFESCYETPNSDVLWHLVQKLGGGDYGGVEDLLYDHPLCERTEAVYRVAMQHPDVQALFKLEGLEIEKDVTQFGVTMGSGVVCRGRMDLHFRDADGRRVIWDWKTRANLSHAPFTDEDFRSTPQLAYYACVLHKYAPEDNGIRVIHANVLRDTGRVAVYGTVFEPEYLEKMFRYFDNYLVPEMERAYKAGQDHVAKVQADNTACFRMGKCNYFSVCPVNIEPSDVDSIDTLWREVNMRILSEEAPPEEIPVPVPDKPIAVLEGVTPRVASAMQEVGLYRLADVRNFVSERSLRCIVGIGEVTNKKIMASLNAYYAEYVE